VPSFVDLMNAAAAGHHPFQGFDHAAYEKAVKQALRRGRHLPSWRRHKKYMHTFGPLLDSIERIHGHH
jgi:hypothetical protein